MGAYGRHYEHEDDDGFATSVRRETPWEKAGLKYEKLVEDAEEKKANSAAPYTPIPLTVLDHRFLKDCGIKGEWQL